MTLTTTTDPTRRSGDTQPIPPGAASVALARQATDAYQAEQQARRTRTLADAQGDLATLTAKLAELGVTALDDPYISGTGHVRVTLADLTGVDPDQAGLVNEDGESPAVYRLFALARDGQVRLQAHTRFHATTGDAGPLHTLADIGRALWEGAAHEPEKWPGYTELADQQLTYRAVPDGHDTEAVCDVLTALTYAVLAVADRIPEAAETLAERLGKMTDDLSHAGQ